MEIILNKVMTFIAKDNDLDDEAEVAKRKNKILPIPDGFTAEDIKIESGICTGEKTIGFYCAADKKLHYAELVRNNDDIEDFYRKYGIEAK